MNPNADAHSRGRRSGRRPWSWLAAAAVLVSLTGCDGCTFIRPVSEEEAQRQLEERERQEKPKPDFEVAELKVLTSDDSPIRTAVKPGHWMSITQRMRANNYDFSARLESATVDRNGAPRPIEHTPFGIRTTSPALLPKGQAKQFDTPFFLPRLLRTPDEQRSLVLESRLLSRRGGREMEREFQPTVIMPEHQYYLLVLAGEPERYTFLNRLHAISPPTDSLVEDSLQFYRVVRPRFTRRAPVPSHPLLWSTIAVVIWDDLTPNTLSPDQQDAMVDWLHWGGQLIVSGPRSLAALQQSFLGEYLPARAGATIELDAERLAEFNETFALADGDGGRVLLEPTEGAFPGIELSRRPGGVFPRGAGELIAEQRVGRGRVVVTSFSLDERPLTNWDNYDGVFNVCLLRRPSRRFYQGEHGVLSVRLDRFRSMMSDPRLTTATRFFTRDLDDPAAAAAEFRARRQTNDSPLYVDSPEGTPRPRPRPDLDDWRFCGYRTISESGVAGWSDFSGPAHAARLALREAAGITVPESTFVLKVLAVYIAVLVPVNWLVFWMIGRVEWAWLAAPLIAVVGGVAVVRTAQLDIGFARSRTELAVIEAHAGLPRAHLTRYTALYTSLSSRYSLAFSEPSALALPFSTDPNYNRLANQGISVVEFERGRDARLSNLLVASNSTGMVHSEQMLPLGGALAVERSEESGRPRLVNGTKFAFRDVGVIRRLEPVDGDASAPRYELAWVGEFEPGEAWTLDFAESDSTILPQWRESSVMGSAAGDEDGQVSLGRLVELACQRLVLLPGEMRMVGWMDQDPPGLTITPDASQKRIRVFVLAHLEQAPLPPIEPDANNAAMMIAAGARDPLDAEEDFPAESFLQP